MERPLSIGQLAHATGVAAKTIRYYEQMGVLPAPPRSRAGYRQYARRDVHRLLFIRRARALGLPLGRLKILTADLDGRPSPAMRPRLRQLVTEHLQAVRQQIADFQVLEQQLEQVLQRLRTRPSAKPSEDCQCLESAVTSTAQPTSRRLPARKRGGTDMSPHRTMESMTRLAITSNGDCDCGCSCAARDGLPAKQQEQLPPRRVAVSAGTEERRPRHDAAVDSRGPRR